MDIFKTLFFRTLLNGFVEDEGGSDSILGIEESGENNEESNGEDEGEVGKDKEQGKQREPSWRDELLPDDLKGLPLFEKYNSPQEALKAFAEAQKLIGKKGIIPPGENATDEEKAEFMKQVYKAIGEEVPEKAENYELPDVEDLPEELKDYDAMLKDKIITYAAKKGFSNQRAVEAYEMAQEILVDSYNESVRQQEEAIKGLESALREEWGKSYDTNLSKAKSLAQKFDPTIKSFLRQNEHDPRLIKMLVDIADMVSEDTLKGEPKKMVLSPEDARREILRIKADANHPFNVPDHPEHQLAVEQMDDLYRQAYPELQETR